MEFFVITSSGKEGPFDCKALERLFTEGKVRSGVPVVCAGTEDPISIEEAIARAKVEAAGSDGVAPGTPSGGGAATVDGRGTSLSQPGRGRAVLGRPPRRVLRRPAPAPLQKSSRATILVIAGCALFLFGFCLTLTALDRRPMGLAELGVALLATACFLGLSIGVAEVFSSHLVTNSPGKNRFPGILVASTLILVTVITVFVGPFGRGDPGGPKAAPAPIPFRDGKFEITPAPGWEKWEDDASDIQLVQGFSKSFLDIDLFPSFVTPTAPLVPESLPPRLWEDLIAPLKGQITWGPEPFTQGSLPALWLGYKQDDEAREGIWAVFAAKHATLLVWVRGSASEFPRRRGEIDAMLASIRQR